MSIGDLFERDPTRRLEEVQKVDAVERAETDVAEFYETRSAKRALTELGDVIRMEPGEDARFLYLHANFGSGKTHLLKLVGLVVDTESVFAGFGTRLAEEWPGFDDLARSIAASPVDRLTPVFLNLLDRDASKEPPLPFLVFEAMGRELGYPTDPVWLLEWAWNVDVEYEGVWDALRTATDGEQTFEEVLDERASLRRWLYEVLPALDETTGTDLDSRTGVKASIERAEADVDPDAFDPTELVERVETATDALNEGAGRTEFLLGLDEVALFVGDSRRRYGEFEETMDALQRGPNPVVVATGQYSLPATRASLVDEPPADHWTRRQVPLEGAETGLIVRKRWLRKSPGGRERVSSLLSSTSDLSLETSSSIENPDPDPVESYPFREYDLTLLRTVMQELGTRERVTDREHVHGRALLVVVRSLFTTFEWASADVGSLVTWDELFDLLVEETTDVPRWVQEMLDDTLIPTFGDETAWEVRVSKALFLLNRIPSVPATSRNLGRLLLHDATASVDECVEETRSALDALVDERTVLTKTNGQGDEVYTLVSREQEDILRRARTRAEGMARHQLSAWLETRLREIDDFFGSDGNRHEVDVGTERLVPLRYEYAVLDSTGREPNPEYDAVRIRVLADDAATVSDRVKAWQDANDDLEDGEHVLVCMAVSETTLDRIRNVIGMGQVLDEETEGHPELEREHRTERRRLVSSVREMLDEASVYTAQGYRGERPSALRDVVEAQVQTVFGSARTVLSRPLVEVDDAKRLADFFRGNGEWPFAASDAVTMGVETENAEIADTGWCREFIDEYESRDAVDVETLLRRTRTATSDYRGTPRESIAALLLVLATSNEPVALKRDDDYVTDPATMDRLVRTKGGLTSLQVRFGVETVDPKAVRSVVLTLLGRAPHGDDPDGWLAELGRWTEANSLLVKRTFKVVSKKFDVPLETLEEALSPGFEGGEIDARRLVEDGVRAEAETFADARQLFVAGDGEEPLWERVSDVLELMASVYPGATITARMRSTAEGGTVPTNGTVSALIRDATAHHVNHLQTQYRRITGDTVDASSPDRICTALGEWLDGNERAVRTLLDDATDEFDGVSFDDLESVFETAWHGGTIDERALVDPAVRRQARSYGAASNLLEGDPSPWSRLRSVADDLREGNPRSPTTEAVGTVLAASRPPSLQRVRRLVEEATDSAPPGASDDVWGTLGRVAEDLRRELPNAAITDDVTAMLDADDRPSDERATELLDEAEMSLNRIREVRNRLDGVQEGAIVVMRSDEA